MLYKADQYPQQPLGPVSFLWRPHSTTLPYRQLWIWAHPTLKQVMCIYTLRSQFIRYTCFTWPCVSYIFHIVHFSNKLQTIVHLLQRVQFVLSHYIYIWRCIKTWFWGRSDSSYCNPSEPPTFEMNWNGTAGLLTQDYGLIYWNCFSWTAKNLDIHTPKRSWTPFEKSGGCYNSKVRLNQ